jgi:hypothetical protein
MPLMTRRSSTCRASGWFVGSSAPLPAPVTQATPASWGFAGVHELPHGSGSGLNSTEVSHSGDPSSPSTRKRRPDGGGK